MAAALALADGMCGLADGSSAGDWRQPTIQELCSAWSGSTLFPCPASAASGSLVDSSVGPPTVVNAKGDAVWSEGDAFAGVPSTRRYWSATSLDNVIGVIIIVVIRPAVVILVGRVFHALSVAWRPTIDGQECPAFSRRQSGIKTTHKFTVGVERCFGKSPVSPVAVIQCGNGIVEHC